MSYTCDIVWSDHPSFHLLVLIKELIWKRLFKNTAVFSGVVGNNVGHCATSQADAATDGDATAAD